jgi:hypothetical protein
MQPRLTAQAQKHTCLKGKGVHAMWSWQHAADPARVAGIADGERETDGLNRMAARTKDISGHPSLFLFIP